MCRWMRWLSGFVLGAVIGAILGLMLTRQSGPELRRRIQERVSRVVAEGRQAAEATRLELTAQFEALKQPATHQ